MNNKMEANGYVVLFENVKSRVGSDDVALAIVEQVSKDARVERMNAGNGNSHTSRASSGVLGDQPATAKQLGYLTKLGVDFGEGLTKQQASNLIDAHS